MAVNKFQNGGVDSLYGTAGNWSQGTVPTASDGHVTTFDATSPNCTIASNRVANIIDFTGYTNTITFTNNLTVSGNITLGSTMLFSGAGVLSINATGTISSGVTCPQPFTLTAAMTVTISGTWINSGLVTIGSGSTSLTINTGTLAFSGSLTHGHSTGDLQGSATIRCTGTGTLTSNSNIAGTFRLNFVVNSAGTLTFSNPLRLASGGTFTYTAGTVSGGALLCRVGGATLNTAGMTWNTVTVGGTSAASQTVTLTSNLTLTGLLSVGGGTTTQTINGFAIAASGGVTHSASTGAVSGTTTIGMTDGALTGPTSTGRINNVVNLNGTITPTTNAPRLADVRLASAVIFAGSVGIDADAFTATVPNVTNKLVSTVTYRVRTALALAGAPTQRMALQATTGGSRAILTLDSGASQDVREVNATDIDSSAGAGIIDYDGSISNTVNWTVSNGGGGTQTGTRAGDTLKFMILP